jgi:3'(2'), 5'-bisphosphate nucleotidase
MNADPWQREFDVAFRAVRDGALLARDIRQHVRAGALLKTDQSPVTVADFAVQALVAHRLAETFPEAPLVAEEDAAALRAPAGRTMLESVLATLRGVASNLDSIRVLDLIDRGRAVPAERFWTLDPVDGTRGFVRGDHYVVALALIVRGRVEIGLIGCPELVLTDEPRNTAGSIAFAIRNRGAFRAPPTGDEFIPLHVSSCHDPRLARVLRSFEAQHIGLDTFNRIVSTLRVQAPAALMDSQAKHVVIAAGRADLLIRVPATKSFRDKIWDQAAGSLIVDRPAGGSRTCVVAVSILERGVC